MRSVHLLNVSPMFDDNKHKTQEYEKLRSEMDELKREAEHKGQPENAYE